MSATKITKKAETPMEPQVEPGIKPKPVGRPIKEVELSDIRIKLLEAHDLCIKYRQTSARPLMLLKRFEKDLGRMVSELKRKDDDTN